MDSKGDGLDANALLLQQFGQIHSRLDAIEHKLDDKLTRQDGRIGALERRVDRIEDNQDAKKTVKQGRSRWWTSVRGWVHIAVVIAASAFTGWYAGHH